VRELFSRLRENLVYTQNTVGALHNGADVTIASGCSKRPSSSFVVCLVHLVYLVQANKQDKPNKPNKRDRPDRPNRPNEQDRLADFFSILLGHEE
jgi:hypothetical protein